MIILELNFSRLDARFQFLEGNLTKKKRIRALSQLIKTYKWPLALFWMCFNFLSVFHSSLRASEREEFMLEEAEEHFEATLFDKAAFMYEEILAEKEELSRKQQEHVRMRLAQSHFALKHYKDAITLLESPFASGDLKKEALFWKALSYRYLGQPDKALRLLEEYFASGSIMPTSMRQRACYEWGVALFEKGDWRLAEEKFNAVFEDPRTEDLYLASQVYLSRIELHQDQPELAESRLSGLEEQIQKSSPLRFEWEFVRGEANFHLEKYSEAAGHFERSLEYDSKTPQPWFADSMYYLGLCFLKLGEKDPASTFFAKAEKIFQDLLEFKPEERYYLALGELYVAMGTELDDSTGMKQAEELLAKPGIFSSKESQARALFLRAEAAKNSKEALVFYQALSEEEFKETPYHVYGWRMKGLHDYKAGLDLLATGDKAGASVLFDKAAQSFQQIFDINKAKDRESAALAMQYKAQALAHKSTPEGRLQAIACCDVLISRYPDILQSLKDPGSVFFLRGLIASYSASWKGGDKYAEWAEQSLQKCLAEYPQSPCADRALFTLGVVKYYRKQYLEAEKCFAGLARTFPGSPLEAEAYFWAAKASENLNFAGEQAKEYRKKVYTNFPGSPYAPEAYFAYYPFRDYLQGDRAAIKHLQNFKEQFPNAPYLIVAHYLIGMDYKRDRKTPEGRWIRKKSMNEAIESFLQAEKVFDAFFAANAIPGEHLQYMVNVRYRSILERALGYLAVADESEGAKRQIYLEYAIGALERMRLEFVDKQNPESCLLSKSESYRLYQEESGYWLAQAYAKAGEQEKSKRTLAGMLEDYASSGIVKGYFLSRAHYDLGKIAVSVKDYAGALDSFVQAEEAAKGHVLNTDQKIDLWIQQSLCCKELNDMDKAMLILSKAINDDAISSLRVKAMYLRAEIYALQGRHELARKQLEATSKKGGEWAMKAKQKLDEEYGI